MGGRGSKGKGKPAGAAAVPDRFSQTEINDIEAYLVPVQGVGRGLAEVNPLMGKTEAGTKVNIRATQGRAPIDRALARSPYKADWDPSGPFAAIVRR